MLNSTSGGATGSASFLTTIDAVVLIAGGVAESIDADTDCVIVLILELDNTSPRLCILCVSLLFQEEASSGGVAHKADDV